MVPEKCEMPDLSDLEPALFRGILLRMFTGEPGLSHEQSLYRKTFIRLVDKSIGEYQAARQLILTQLEDDSKPFELMMTEGRLLCVHHFVDCFEDCINALRRALRLLDRIKDTGSPLALPRLARRSVEAREDAVKNVRNTVEHIDEVIQRGELSDGQAVALWFSKDGLGAEVGSFAIRFFDVSVTLRRMHEIAASLLQADVVAAPHS